MKMLTIANRLAFMTKKERSAADKTTTFITRNAELRLESAPEFMYTDWAWHRILPGYDVSIMLITQILAVLGARPAGA